MMFPKSVHGFLAIMAAGFCLAAPSLNAATPIYLDDPRLMPLEIKNASGNVIKTNWYIPKEIGADGKPMLHSKGFLSDPLDPKNRLVGARYSGSGYALSGLQLNEPCPVAVQRHVKEFVFDVGQATDTTPSGFAGGSLFLATSAEAMLRKLSGNNGSTADKTFQSIEWSRPIATPTNWVSKSMSLEFPTATLAWELFDSKLVLYRSFIDFGSKPLINPGNDVFICFGAKEDNQSGMLALSGYVATPKLPNIRGFISTSFKFLWMDENSLARWPSDPIVNYAKESVTFFYLEQVDPIERSGGSQVIALSPSLVGGGIQVSFMEKGVLTGLKGPASVEMSHELPGRWSVFITLEKGATGFKWDFPKPPAPEHRAVFFRLRQ